MSLDDNPLLGVGKGHNLSIQADTLGTSPYMGDWLSGILGCSSHFVYGPSGPRGIEELGVGLVRVRVSF